MKQRHAFTLIEMLVVIAIISVIAALVVNMNGRAQQMKHRTMVEADKHSLIISIESYQSRLNYFPPDNGNNLPAVAANNLSLYELYTATNQLLYELTGGINNDPANSGYMHLFNGTPTGIVSANISAEFKKTYNRFIVNNAATGEDPARTFYRPAPQKYAFYTAQPDLAGFLVPIKNVDYTNQNFWHYDSSTSRRHNDGSFDLWAEYVETANHGVPVVVTNGNW